MEALHKQPRLDDKGGERRGENSWAQTAAKSCLLFFRAAAFVFSG